VFGYFTDVVSIVGCMFTFCPVSGAGKEAMAN
jgi:hypothetical protein